MCCYNRALPVRRRKKNIPLNNRPIRILYFINGLEGDGSEPQLCERVKGVHDVDGYEPHVGVLEANDSGHAYMLDRSEEWVRIADDAKEMVRARFDLRRFIEDDVGLYREPEQKGKICQRRAKAS